MTPVRDYLATRRTVPVKQLGPPGPDSQTLNAVLTIAARVPDHGKLAPWRFIVIEGEARDALGQTCVALSAAKNPNASAEMEEARFTRAPVVVAVVSTAAIHPKIPEWEQVLSAGAVCLNMLHAAAAHGYSAQWLTEWMAYDADFLAHLGLSEGEKVAGFIHIGTPTVPPTERSRPELDQIVTRYSPPLDS
ncbi:MAG: nitroreductase [Pseudomonadota bacterium]